MLRDWLARRFVFLPDPVGVGVFGEPGQDVELVRDPVWQVSQIDRYGTVAGDCDDAATLGAALGLAAGLPMRFQVVGFVTDGPFSHVWVDALTTRGWLNLDVTRRTDGPSVRRGAVWHV